LAVTAAHTLDEFLTLPEQKPALEFVDGMVTQKVSPKGQHSVLQATLLRLLDEAARKHGARALPELRATFAGAAVVPDVSLYCQERIPRDAQGRVANDFLEPPDIAVEIASSDQSVTGLVRRCLWYVGHGVPIALLIDPVDESVLVFRPDEPAVAYHGMQQIDLHEILPDLDLSAEQLFTSLRA